MTHSLWEVFPNPLSLLRPLPGNSSCCAGQNSGILKVRGFQHSLSAGLSPAPQVLQLNKQVAK